MTMTTPSQDDIVEVTFTPVPAWMLLAAGGIFLVLGLLFTTPFVHQQQIVLGLVIASASAVALVGGLYWLKHLPVLLRFTPDELQFPSRKQKAIRWLDVERVEMKKVNPFAGGDCLCIKLKAKGPRPGTTNALHRLRGLVGADHDLILNDQTVARGASWLVTECQRRISFAVSRQQDPDPEATGSVAQEGYPSAATLADLGPCEATFAPSRRGKVKALLVLLGTLVPGIGLAVLPFIRPPNPGQEGGSYAVCFTLGGMTIFAGLLGTVPTLLRSQRTIHVHARGFRVEQRSRSLMYRWTEVAGLRVRKETEAIPSYLVDVVELLDDTTVDIDPNQVRHAATLCTLLEQAIRDTLVPSMKTRLEAGEKIAFGPLVLTRGGIQATTHFLSWQAITAIEANRREETLVIEHREVFPRISFPLTEVPNVATLHALWECFAGT
jgi:hypothetical protein